MGVQRHPGVRRCVRPGLELLPVNEFNIPSLKLNKYLHATFLAKNADNRAGLRRRAVEVLQVNLGRYCNQACIHCHVEAGPTRTEMMPRRTVDAVLRFLERAAIPTIDITGGAPELHDDFDYLVESAKDLNRHVMDRCNLTVIFEPGKDYLPEFFARHRIELVCSLPCYSEENVDKQRGKGTFDQSIALCRNSTHSATAHLRAA